MSTDDDDALSWAGDETPSRIDRAARTPRRSPAEVTGLDDEAHASARDDENGGQPGSVALVLLGLLGGVHLLYAVGWIVAIAPLQAVFGPADVLGGALFGLSLAFAAASPVVWFVAAFWFTRSRPSWHRIAALVAGAVLLVPWPFVVGVR